MSDERTYKSGLRFVLSDKDAAILGPAWEELEARLNQPPTVDDLLNEARNPDSPFHSYFEWDPSVQQEIYLRTQAAALIRALDVVLPEYDGQRVRAIVPMHDGSHGFMSTTKALRERPDVIQAQVSRAKHDARAYYERYVGWVNFAEFSPVMDVMEAARRLAYSEETSS